MLNDTDDFLGPVSQHSATQHKTSGATPLISKEPAPAPWVYDDTFSIVHHEGCRTCRHYMMHISDTVLDDSDTESYNLALHLRDKELRRRFVEGFRSGRSIQQEHDTERLKTYRAQRDEARASEAVYKTRVEETEAVVRRLEDELLDLQIAYDTFRSQSPCDWDSVSDWSDSPIALDASSLPAAPQVDSGESSDSQSPELLDQEDTDDYEEDEGDYESASISSDEEGSEAEVESEEEEETVGLAHPSDDEGADDVAALDDTGPVLQLNPLSFSTHQDTSEESDTYLNDNHSTPSPDFPNGQQSSAFFPAPRPSAPKLGSYSLVAIREQMQLAHRPDRQDVLTHIKSLVAQAHRTSPALRTEVQKVLLAEWRRPSPVPSISVDEAVYVDASGTGIGFVFGEHWQAWRFKKVWTKDCRQVQWAEAVAVELGIRLMIEAGFSGKALSLRSDNQQVVQAISGERVIGEIHATQIVQNVHRLCKKYCINLSVSWIPGVFNPADAPSRLLPVGGKRTRFPYHIGIPQHLQEFVAPYH